MKRIVFIVLISLVVSCEWVVSPEHVGTDNIMDHAYKLYKQKNYAAAIDTLNKAVLVLSKRDEPEELANCYNRLGLLYWGIKDTAISLNYYNRALEFAKAVSPDLQAKILTNMGNGFYYISDYTKAFYFYSQIETLDLPKDNLEYNCNLINLGNTFMQVGQYSEARHKAKDALEFYKKTQDTIDVNNCYVIMALCDGNEGKPFEIDYSAIKDEYVSLSLCEIYLKQNKLKKCDSLAQLLVAIGGNHSFLESAYYFQGLSAYKQGNYIQSLLYLNKADEVVDSMDYIRCKEILKAKVDNYIKLGDLGKVESTQNLLYAVDDKIVKLNEKNRQELLAAQRTAQYQHQALESELKNLKYTLFVNRLFLLIASILIALFFVTSYSVILKKKNKSLHLAIKHAMAQSKANFFK